MDIQDRLRNRTIQTSDCWLWAGAKNATGYGLISFCGVLWRAHRLSYAVFVGPIAPGLLIRHKCDTRACINPAHLEVGTAKQNSEDTKSRGRVPAGQRHPRARITAAQVNALRHERNNGAAISELAKKYEQSYSNVYKIINKMSWTCE